MGVLEAIRVRSIEKGKRAAARRLALLEIELESPPNGPERRRPGKCYPLKTAVSPISTCLTAEPSISTFMA